MTVLELLEAAYTVKITSSVLLPRRPLCITVEADTGEKRSEEWLQFFSFCARCLKVSLTFKWFLAFAQTLAALLELTVETQCPLALALSLSLSLSLSRSLSLSGSGTSYTCM